MPGNTTVAPVGDCSASVLTTGHDKGCFTVILAAIADGKKLKPSVEFKWNRPVPKLNKVTGVVVGLSKNSWMNEALTTKWVDSV